MRYYSKSQAWALGVGGTIFGVIIALLGVGIGHAGRVRDPGARVPAEVACLIVGAMFVAWSARAARAGAVVRVDRLTVRNPMRSVVVHKTEVRSFSLGPNGIYRSVGRAHLRDGRELRIWGIQGSQIGNTAAQRQIDGLNAWLQATGGDDQDG